MIRAIIFDCFGVLVGQGFDATYRMAGGDPVADRAFVADILGAANLGLISSAEMTKSICARLEIDQNRWDSAVAKTEQPDRALLDYIKTLKDTYKVAILSNANRGTLDRKFSREQLDIFDTVVVSAEVGMIKPDRAIYELTAERLGVAPLECVFTDDSPGYCRGAEQAGMTAIHYHHQAQFEQELDAALGQK